MQCARLIALFLVLLGSGHAETLPYEFATADIFLPGSSVRLDPTDINAAGVILTNTTFGVSEAVIAYPHQNTFKTVTFRCSDLTNTGAGSINDKGQIVGSCSDATRKTFGFVRDRNGSHILLDFPGADHTLASGINDRGDVVGWYFNPFPTPEQSGSGFLRIHGFLWDGEKYSTIDFPLPNTATILHRINRSGQILGQYTTFVPTTNEILAIKWFVYDNGNFILDFPDPLEHIGGPAIYLADMNDSGQIIGLRSNGGPDWDGVFLYDHGTFYDIEVPVAWVTTWVSGMNNKGQFVGTYMVQVGIEPFYGGALYEFHGFIATPSPRLRISRR